MSRLITAIVVAIGLLGSGWFIGHGFVAGRHDRYVTVKGLAERDVKADLALWPLRFVEAGNDLGKVQTAIQHDESSVEAFLKRHAIDEKAIVWRTLDVTDRAAQAYGTGQYPTRFIIARTLMVRSSDVDKLEAASQATSELVGAGVVLNNENGDNNGPTYLFNGLTRLKPEMIAEATAHARAAAQQFAHDSGSRLGGIRTASQGLFEILARDKAPMLQEQRQVLKTVRVVATIDYSLAD
ncbi:MAG: SIMPL domain-containing protein [Rudaea sp.]